MLVVAILAFPAATLAAQTPSQTQPAWQQAAGGSMAFEVASVRQVNPDATWPGNPFEINAQDDFTPTEGLFRANARLIMYIIFAYKITDSSQYNALVAQLPKWGNTDQFLIEARSPGNPTKNQYRLMMQALLTERFGLKLQIVDKLLPVYALVLDKPSKLGAELHPHPGDVPCAVKPQPPLPQVPGQPPPAYCDTAQRWQPAPGTLHMRMLDVTPTQIADYVSSIDFSIGGLRGLEPHAIVDETGYRGKFDFNIEFGLPQRADSDSAASAPDFVQALRDQLGLKLQKRTALVPVYLVDEVHRPTEN